jgi:hypothetical protein
MVDFGQGYLDRALAYCQEGLQLANELPDYNNVATCLGLSACILAKQGEQFRAARMSGAAKALYEKQGRKPMEDSSLDAILPGWRERSNQGAILKAYEEGREMAVEQAVAFALSLRLHNRGSAFSQSHRCGQRSEYSAGESKLNSHPTTPASDRAGPQVHRPLQDATTCCAKWIASRWPA